MKWLDDMKEAGVAFKEWGRWRTIIGAVMAGSLVTIAGELFVICIKLWYNMLIDMSKGKPIVSAGNSPQVRYSASRD